jgi:hypothetical protein
MKLYITVEDMYISLFPVAAKELQTVPVSVEPKLSSKLSKVAKICKCVSPQSSCSFLTTGRWEGCKKKGSDEALCYS